MCLDLIREWKGLGSPELVGWKSIIRVTREHIYDILRLKGPGHKFTKCKTIAASTRYVCISIWRENIGTCTLNSMSVLLHSLL